MNRRKIAIFSVIAVALAVIYVCYTTFFSPTKIALVNFPNFQVAGIAKSNTSSFIKVKEVTVDEINTLGRYDAAIVFAMGIRLTAEQREYIQRLADKGMPIYTTAATNPENNICSLDSIQVKAVSEYLGGGTRKNYRNLLSYIRYHIDGKKAFTDKPQPAEESISDVLYYMNDEVGYTSVEEYEKFYKDSKHFKVNAPKVAILGSVSGDPFGGNREHLDSLISSFEQAGFNVYPIASFMKRIDFLKEIQPDAVVYMPHGRLAMGGGDAAVAWLKERNIPLFCPLTIIQPESEWLSSKMGMMGGFLSQSIVMPELDGGIVPYVVNAQYVDKDGYYVFRAIPDRLSGFVKTVSKYVDLKRKPNSEKRVAIYYFKGVGQNAMVSAGLETLPSLYNFLKRLQAEGYTVKNLPAALPDFEKLVMTQGAVLGTYAEGAFDSYLKTGKPVLIEKADYDSWVNQSLAPEMYATVTDSYGEFPGSYMAVEHDGKQQLAVARIDLGNVVLLPQPMPGLGGNSFQLVHGAKTAPPHTYIASYLWTQYGFNADALIHFGTHGSLEFTPEKQVALSKLDWPDRLVGSLPHFYLYTISNVGEGVIAKRRSYATLVSYLTPPFMESNTRGQYKDVENKIKLYHDRPENANEQAALAVKKAAVALGIHRDLGLDSVLSKSYTADEIAKLENFVEEIATERMQGSAYILGVPYEKTKIQSSVMAMSTDPIAYSLAQLDRVRGRATEVQLNSKPFFTQRYLNPTKLLVQQVLAGSKTVNDQLACSVMNITAEELAEARAVTTPKSARMAAQARAATDTSSTKKGGGMPKGHPAGVSKNGSMPSTSSGSMPAMAKQQNAEVSKEQKQLAMAIMEVVRTLENIRNYETYLQSSPQEELNTLVNSLNGGYIAPSPAGDPIANPNTLPTGRNLYAVNAEATPSEVAWEKGVVLAKETLEQYYKKHGSYPKKVSYTFWSSEFIETEGATIAQVLYMLGVEPVRDVYGRISDIRLIPSEVLGRPRVDVVVQTSGQFRDVAASRLFLINRAVEMAAAAGKEEQANYVAEGTVEAERLMVEQGISPKEARDLSTARIFGGVNGGYGTGITGMVQSGDRWEKEDEIAKTYINNMGALYGNEKSWGEHNKQVFQTMLHSTDVVIQPRQSNTWGALSLDHVYEFMGGMNLAVRNVTGKDPEAYFSDYRNRNKVHMQELKEAIGVEARTTLFNPNYIKEQMNGGASSADGFSELFHNTYGWNVMKPAAIDKEMWDKMYDVYVKDEYKLNVRRYFEQKNPAALQEMTAVMLETARKGYWPATETQLKDIAELHTQLVKDYKPACSGFVCDNAKLKDFIGKQVDQQAAQQYAAQISNVRSASVDNSNGVVMKKEQLSNPAAQSNSRKTVNGGLIAGALAIALVLIIIFIRKRRKVA